MTELDAERSAPVRPREVDSAFRLWVGAVGVAVGSYVVVSVFMVGVAERAVRQGMVRQGQDASEGAVHSALVEGWAFLFVSLAVVCAVALWVGVKMRQGRKWARALLAVATGVAVLSMMLFILIGATRAVLFGVVPDALMVMAARRMFSPGARPYFARSRAAGTVG